MAKIAFVRRRKDKNKGLEPNLYPDPRKLQSGIIVTYYKYKNPKTGKFTHWGEVSREEANRNARILNARLGFGSVDLIGKVMGTADLTWSKVIEDFKEKYPKWQAWGKRTSEEHQFKLNKFNRDLGKKDFATWPLEDLNKYIEEEFSGDGRIKARALMVHIYKFAVSKGICQENLAEKTLPPLPAKRKRERMTPELFKAVKVHPECPDWLACAMDLSLKTLQGRLEITLVSLSDIRDGFIYFIRNKTKDKTERAYIRIHIDAELQAIIDRCKRLPVYGDRLIRRARKRNKKEAAADWSAVTPRMLTDEFNRIRDLTGLVSRLPQECRPTIYESRSLGGRMLRQQLKAKGWTDKKAKEAVNALMGHTTLRMTEHYLEGDEINWTSCQQTIDISAL